MYGTHHKTGKKIRLLQHDTSTWKSNKTLVWLKSDSCFTESWNRYDVGVVGSKTYTECLRQDVSADIVVCTDLEDRDWISNSSSHDVRLIFASKAVLDLFGPSYFEEAKINNILCLEELDTLYPFLNSPWDGTTNDACTCVALILRFSNSFPLHPSKRDLYGLKLSDELKPPMKLYYLTQYYTSKNVVRQEELNMALQKNIENPYIDHIVLLNETDYTSKIPKSSKVQQVVIKKRLHYKDVMEYIVNHIPANALVAFANTDIYCDETIRYIWSTDMNNKFFALLRYENGKIYGPRADSQDTWILQSDSLQQRKINFSDFDFSFGVSGCDNAITLEMLRYKFLVVNPSLTIKTHHLHSSEVRTYSLDDITDKDVYLYISPTALHDMEACTRFPKEHIVGTLKHEAFNRILNCTSVQRAETYCKMLEKSGRYKFSPSDKNTYSETKRDIYKFNSVFQTNTGLIYDYNKIYVGTSKKAEEYWSTSQVSTLSPSLRVKKAYVAPLPNDVVVSVENYLLYYLPKILLCKRMYDDDTTGDFWCPNKQMYIKALSKFKWSSKTLPLLSHTETPLVFAETAYVWFPSDNLDVSMEEMDTLRDFLKPSNEAPSTVVYMDETYITKEFVRTLEKISPVKVIFKDTAIERKIELLQSAISFIVYNCDATRSGWGYVWCMPKGSTVHEFQCELTQCGELLHISNASSLNHNLYTVGKGKLNVQQCIESIDMKTVVAEELVSPKALDLPEVLVLPKVLALPKILVPKKVEGFYGHAGDSFREVVDLWAERGLVQKEYADCKNIWLHALGDTLLYDRPNYDWIRGEQGWKNALFGNPKPLAKGVAWSFWPRRPRLVEAMLSSTSKFVKTKDVVFYGKVENAVQEAHRTKHDWSTCCSEYYLAGLNEPPKYSEQEYLINLSKAKYGLCLAGYGKKCHREVECMAFGCVPLVAPEVDMDSYANPPKEGVHYLRVQNPEDLLKKVGEISKEQWLTMSSACSAWYLENCSVEGLWNLTKKLTHI